MNTQEYLKIWWRDNKNLLEFLVQLPDGCIPNAQVSLAQLILDCESEEVLKEVKKLLPNLIDRIQFDSLLLKTSSRQLKPTDVHALKKRWSRMYSYKISSLQKVNERIQRCSNPMSLVQICPSEDFGMALSQNISPKRQNILFNDSLESLMHLDKKTLEEIDLKNFWVAPRCNPLDFIKIQSKDWIPPHLQEIYKLGGQQSIINAHVYPGHCPLENGDTEYGIWTANIEFVEINGTLYNIMETLDFQVK